METYILKTGDTLLKIARDYHISLEQLLEMNPQIDNENEIYLGQAIQVPTAPNQDTLDPNLGMTPIPTAPPNQDTPIPDASITPTEPPWLEIAKRELATKVKEIPGSADNPRIVEYHQSTTLCATDDETPWCSAFVNWCIEQAGLEGTKSASSGSWLHWGQEISEPCPGCIVIFKGHVGFYCQADGDRISLLGGNQSNQVSISSYYSKAKVLGYRWPQEIPLPK